MRTLVVAMLLTVHASAQSTPVGTSVSASRMVSIPADEALLEINLITAREVPLESVLRVLEPLGVRREHLTSASTSQGSGRVLPGPTPGPLPPPLAMINTYGFLAAVDPAGVPGWIEAYQQVTRAPQPGILNIAVTGSLNASDGALEANRLTVLPTLWADARRRATQWRQAAGITAGDVTALSDSVAVLGRSTFTQEPPFVVNTGTKATYTLNLRSGEGPRTISAFASKAVVLAAEDVAVTVQVEAQPAVTGERIVQALAPAGFVAGDMQRTTSTGRDFGLTPGVPQPPLPPSAIVYELVSTQPAENTDSVLRALDQVQRTPPAGVTAIRFGAAMRVRPSTIDLLRQNLTPLLLEDARRRAGDLARLAGWRLGALVSMTEGPQFLGVGGFIGAGTLGLPSNLRVVTTVSAIWAAE